MKSNIKGRYITIFIVACLLSMSIIASSAAAGTVGSGGVEAVGPSAKAAAIKFADDNKGITVGIAKSLWEYAEIGLDEYKSYVKARDVLAGAGFAIRQSVADIPTCLVATWGSGQPVLGIYEDTDALPGVGHACGHNLNTAAGVVAAMAIKSAMESHHIPGTIKVFLNPAEEVWDVAPLVAAAGYYDDVDVLLSFHAGTENTSEFGSTMAMDHVEYKFRGKAAHASAAPEKGLSALDAVEIMNVAVNYLREHLIQEMRIHYVITDGGAAPNIVPATAASRYFIRAPKYPDVAYARKRIDDCAKAAALATGTELEIGFSSGIYNKVPSKSLALLAIDSINSVGPATFGDDQVSQMEALGISAIPDKNIKEPTGSQSFGSNPIGDVTWKTPSTTLGIATWVPGTAGHSVEAAAQSGAVYGFEGAVQASKALAVMGIELLTNSESLAAVKSEFAERMKGMPPYEGKAMIPEVAYHEAPGFQVTAGDGKVSVKAAETAFTEAAGDVIIVSSMQGDELASYTLSAQTVAQPEYALSIQGGIKPGQRLKITFISAGNSDDAWFYGYVHAR